MGAGDGVRRAVQDARFITTRGGTEIRWTSGGHTLAFRECITREPAGHRDPGPGTSEGWSSEPV